MRNNEGVSPRRCGCPSGLRPPSVRDLSIPPTSICLPRESVQHFPVPRRGLRRGPLAPRGRSTESSTPRRIHHGDTPPLALDLVHLIHDGSTRLLAAVLALRSRVALSETVAAPFPPASPRRQSSRGRVLSCVSIGCAPTYRALRSSATSSIAKRACVVCSRFLLRIGRRLPPQPRGVPPWWRSTAVAAGSARTTTGPRSLRSSCNGYVVIVPNYALSAPGRRAWPRNFEDVREAVRWLRRHAGEPGSRP